MATINGTQSNDFNTGTGLDDFIVGYPTSGIGSGFDDFDGNDTLFGLSGNDTLRGGNQDDSLYGGDGNDFLFGGANPALSGNDYLVGGFGNDTLTGGTGGDSFVFNSSSEGIDTITDFSVTDDTIFISKAGFDNKKLRADSFLSSSRFHIGAAAHDRTDRFIYNSLTGALSFDADGSRGGFAQVQIAQLSAGLAMTKRDIYVTA